MNDQRDTEPVTEPDPRSPYEEVLDELRAINTKLDRIEANQVLANRHQRETRSELHVLRGEFDDHVDAHAEDAYAGVNGGG